jgi:hypothetical protein
MQAASSQATPPDNLKLRPMTPSCAAKCSPPCIPCLATPVPHCFNLGYLFSIGRKAQALNPSLPAWIFRNRPGAATVEAVTNHYPSILDAAMLAILMRLKLMLQHGPRFEQLYEISRTKMSGLPGNIWRADTPHCFFNVGVGRIWARLSELPLSVVLRSRRAYSGN